MKNVGVWMKKLVFGSLVIAAAAFWGASAFAAKALPPSAPPYNWTGFYAGVNAGYGWGNTNTDFNFLPSAAAFGQAPFSIKMNPAGFVGGGQAGYNYQSGIWVFGLEADISYADIKSSGSNNVLLLFPGPGVNAGAFALANQKMDWFGTVRPRLGVTPIDRLLVYATGGLAYGHVGYSALTQFPATPPIQYTGSDSATKAGWAAGGGTEWAIAQSWTVKAEYLYYDLGSTTIIAPSQFPAFTALGFVVQNKFETRGSIVRAGLNYKF